jgi:hypothetical protein
MWALADSGRSYVAYAVDPAGPMGVKGLGAGLWDIRWFDCATGTRVDQLTVGLAAGDHAWAVPTSLGSEVAVSIRLVPATPVEPRSWADSKARYR